MIRLALILSYLLMLPLALMGIYSGITMDNHVLLVISVIAVLAHLSFLCLPKAQALRYLYPGLVTFMLFMVLPIGFTIYIAFTNMGTGHYLTKDEARRLIASETILNQTQGTIVFQLYRHQPTGRLAIVAQNHYGADLDFDGDKDNATSDSVLVLKKQAPFSSEWIQLRVGDVYAMRELISSLTFQMEDDSYLWRYYRADLLAGFSSRFTYHEQDDTFYDSVTRQTYDTSVDDGFYRSQDQVLYPGFVKPVGFGNFKRLLDDVSIKDSLLQVMSWTLVWAFGSVFLTFGLGLVLAVLVNHRLVLHKAVVRILLLIPYAIPFFISVLIFKGFLNKDFGLINQILMPFFASPIPWLDDPFWAKVSCLSVNLWLGFPYMFLVITGILQSVPPSVYEAARLDGASPWQTLKLITLPLIITAMVPLLIGSLAFNLNNFVGIYLLTGGGPNLQNATTPVGSTDILISYTYRLAFEGAGGQDFGLASSIAIIIFVMIALMTLVSFRLLAWAPQSEIMGKAKPL